MWFFQLKCLKNLKYSHRYFDMARAMSILHILCRRNSNVKILPYIKIKGWNLILILKFVAVNFKESLKYYVHLPPICLVYCRNSYFHSYYTFIISLDKEICTVFHENKKGLKILVGFRDAWGNKINSRRRIKVSLSFQDK